MLHTQLRVGRSLLNSHRFTINQSESDLCLCSRTESVRHYLTECFLYTEERRVLYVSMEKLLPTFLSFSNDKKCYVLLNGIHLDSEEMDSRNYKIVYFVQNFIFKTKHF